MAVTVHDVAKKAGVAIGTVSRYLNGYQLREENRLKIEQAIKVLGFKQNIIAKSLRANRSMTIAVMIPHYRAPFFMAVVATLEQILEAEHYSIVLHNFHFDRQKLQEKLQFAKDRQVDGLILFPAYNWEESRLILQEYLHDKIPVVLVEQPLSGVETDVVMIANAHASFRAVEKLILDNHTRIAVVNGYQHIYMFQERLKGYYNAMRTYNLPVDPNWVTFGGFIEAGEYALIKKIFESPNRPTAVYATHYHATIGTMMSLHELHLRIPEDISLIGFDHLDPIDAIDPPLTLVEQPMDRIAQTTAELLLKRIKGDYTDFPQTITLDTKMLVRDSVRKM